MSEITVFGGLLRVEPMTQCLVWADGTEETRARVASRGSMAPSYRVSADVVHVPDRDATDEHPQADLGWCRAYPLRGTYRLVPLYVWDEWASAPGGILWDRVDEPAILERAAALGWRRSAATEQVS